ncbi:FAD/NAD(P)-binding domain-containing protein [Hymenopellis radicata]|nr:FAD/NAD(P)-binding domain-containing protein [Hymenopellis radicata]
MASLKPLSISIVGSGIAGLAAATALRRNGHIVSMVQFDSKIGGEGETTKWTPALTPPLEEHNLLCHRSDLRAELERLAIGPGEGPAAVLHTSSKVVGCDTASGALTFADGRVVQADLVLGADGISSTIRTHILGRVQKSIPSGMTGHRTVLDASKLALIPELDWIAAGESGIRAVYSQSPVGALLLYPCRKNTLVNFNAIVQEKNQEDPDWSASATREEVQTIFAGYHSQFQPVFASLPETVLKWQMRTIPPLETWVRGLAALLGDAAHAMLPSLGQGAAMALEDAAAVGALFPAGTPAADVPARLAAFEALRKPRAEWVARESEFGGRTSGTSWNVARELHTSILEYDAVNAAEAFYKERFGAGEGA